MRIRKEGLIKRASKVAVYDQFRAVDFDFQQKGALVASFAKNCDFENGALRSGFGVKRYFLETDLQSEIAPALEVYGPPKMVFTALVKTEDGLVKRTVGAQAEVDRIFAYNIDEQSMIHLTKPQELLKVLSYVYPNGTTKMIFCCADQLFFYDFTNKITRILSEPLTGACLFHERLFASNKDTLKYSVPMDVGDFELSLNGGGEIAFNDERGEIVWIESFGECIYVFFQYGIAKLTADGAGSEFVLSDVAYNGGRIVPRTACVYENKLVFASYEGIFALDGKKCSKLKDFGYSPIKNSTLRASAGCVGSRYFLYYVDELGNKRSVFLDLEDVKNAGECFVLHGLNQSGGKALCASDYVYSYLDKNGDLPNNEKYLFQAKCDFGSRGEKSVKYISLQGEGTCTLRIEGKSGACLRTFQLGQPQRPGLGETNVGDEEFVGVERKLIGLKGREFSFEFTLQKGCVIRKMIVEYDEVGGVE